MHLSHINIQSWNIFGVFKSINGFQYNKLEDQDFVKHVSGFQIFGLIETHHTSDDVNKIQINGYKCYQPCWKKLKIGRKHGGLAVYVQNSLLPGVSKMPLPGSETIVLKLEKKIFG